jgi:hypothetical protein
MPAAEVLARCIAAIEQGATVEECLARYPSDAKALEPHLRIVARLRQLPPPQMSLAAFARGRAAVAAQARYQQRLQAPFLAAQTNHQPITDLVVAPARQVRAPAPPPAMPIWLKPVAPLRWSALLVTLILVLTAVTFARTVRESLPGSVLYPVKLRGEQVQGYLLAGAGQQAHWYARQVQRRLAELDRLASQGAADPELVATVERQVQQALDASATLGPADRARFFETWLADLRAIQPAGDADATTVVTLGRVIARVEAAAALPPEPLVLLPGDVNEEENGPGSTTTPPATAVEPVAVTGAPDAPASPVVLPTVTPTEFPLLPPPMSTSTPAPTLAPSPTEPPPPPPAPVVDEPESDESRDDESRQEQQVRPPPTNTPEQPTVTPTDVPSPTWTPVTATATTSLAVTVTATSTSTVTPTSTGPAPSPTMTATSTVAPTVTVTPSVTPTPTEDPLVTVTPTPTPSGEGDTPTPLTPGETPTASPTVTSRPGRRTPTPEATPTPINTPTLAPDTPTEEPTPQVSSTSDAGEPGGEPSDPTETPTPLPPE